MARRKRLSPLPLTEPPAAEAPGAEDGPARTRAPIASVSGAAAAEAALGEVAEALESARAEGRLAQPIPLDAVAVHHLARDRMRPPLAAGVDDEMDALVESLRMRGQQMPIEVIDLGPEAAPARYGLISGWRRLTALRRLAAEGQGAEGPGQGQSQEPGTVLAVLRAPESAAAAYVAMVEENEIRQGLSYFERAQVVAQAVTRGAYPDTRTALRDLFSTASRAKRSKIGSFLRVVEGLGGALRYPAALPERLGLRLAQVLEAEDGAAARLSDALAEANPRSAEAEQAVLKSALAAPPRPPRPRPTEHGIVYLSESDGTLTLRGPGVTPAFRNDLIAWLDARDAALDADSG